MNSKGTIDEAIDHLITQFALLKKKKVSPFVLSDKQTKEENDWCLTANSPKLSNKIWENTERDFRNCLQLVSSVATVKDEWPVKCLIDVKKKGKKMKGRQKAKWQYKVVLERWW